MFDGSSDLFQTAKRHWARCLHNSAKDEKKTISKYLLEFFWKLSNGRNKSKASLEKQVIDYKSTAHRLHLEGVCSMCVCLGASSTLSKNVLACRFTGAKFIVHSDPSKDVRIAILFSTLVLQNKRM